MSGDRLIMTLMQHPSVRRLAVANPYRSWPVRRMKGVLGHRDAPFPDTPGRALVAPMRIRRSHPVGDEAIERLYAAYDRRLRRAAGRLGMVRPAVVAVNPFVAAYSPLEWAGPVTYYALDHWAAHPRHRALWPAFESANASIRRRGRAVCAVSAPLLDRLAPTGPTVVVPNGVEPREWRRPPPPPEWFQSLPSPKLLYVGTIDDRLDVDALVDVARRFPNGSVTLVGLVTDPAAITPVRTAPNIRVEPPVGRDAVAGMVFAADVCLLPHRQTALTETMSPLKLYEYLSGGRTVVATDLPPIRDVDQRVMLVEPGGRFADAVAAALDIPAVSDAERLAFVQRHSWHRRHEAILALATRTGADGSGAVSPTEAER